MCVLKISDLMQRSSATRNYDNSCTPPIADLQRDIVINRHTWRFDIKGFILADGAVNVKEVEIKINVKLY